MRYTTITATVPSTTTPPATAPMITGREGGEPPGFSVVVLVGGKAPVVVPGGPGVDVEGVEYVVDSSCTVDSVFGNVTCGDASSVTCGDVACSIVVFCVMYGDVCSSGELEDV